MAEGEETRLIAWSSELRNVHQRLREALNIAQEALESGESNDTATRDLLLYCRGFCTALTRHHEGEDRELFPAIAAAYPQLRETLEYLERDHAMIAHLVNRLETVIATASNPRFTVSRVDIDREGDTYTIDTLRDIHAQMPDAELYFNTSTA